MECPFTFLCLSSEDSRDSSELADITTTDSIPEEFRKQGTTHIPVTATQVLSSSGDERRKWIAAAKKELDNLGSTGAIEAVSPQKKEAIKSKARSEGKKYTELPSKGVFIKPDKYKVRIVACGNMTSEIFCKISTSDLDAAMLRFLLSWGASLPDFAIASLDVTAAFLNAALPRNRVVVLRPYHPLQTPVDSSRSRMASPQSHLRPARGTEPLVGRTDRSPPKAYLHFRGGAILHPSL